MPDGKGNRKRSGSFHYRFLVVEVNLPSPAPATLTTSALMGEVRRAVADLHGDAGLGLLSPSLSLRFWDPAVGAFILRVNRQHATMLRSALTTVTFLEKRQARLVVVHVAGSARTCKRATLRWLSHMSMQTPEDTARALERL